MSKIIFTIFLVAIYQCNYAQVEVSTNVGGIEFYIHEAVTNANGEILKFIVQ